VRTSGPRCLSPCDGDRRVDMLGRLLTRHHPRQVAAAEAFVGGGAWGLSDWC
jgi:hypothetical protein